MNTPSKELIGNVLNCSVKEVFFKSEGDRGQSINEDILVIVKETDSVPSRESINIYELVNKCKIWAFKEGYEIVEEMNIVKVLKAKECIYTSVSYVMCGGVYKPETIFKAIQFIINKKKSTVDKNIQEKIKNLLKVEDIQPGEFSRLEQLLIESFNKNHFETAKSLYLTYMDIKNDTRMLINYLMAISRLDVNLFYDEGYVIATEILFCYNGNELKDAALRIMENYNDDRTLGVLNCLNIGVAWLDEYREQIIEDILKNRKENQ